MYVEASGANNPRKGPFVLQTTLVPVGIGELGFWYSMLGGGIGTLSVDTSHDSGASWTTHWSKAGDQGTAAWSRASFVLDDGDTTDLRFIAYTGTDFDGDAAIDDVNITRRDTPAPSISPAPSTSYEPSSSPTLLPTPSPTTELLSTEDQLDNAVARASSANVSVTVKLASTIVLARGSLNFVDLPALFTIAGEGFGLVGNGQDRCIYMTNTALQLRDLMITNGTAQYGGGIRVTSGSHLKLYNVTVEGNVGGLDGAGVWVSSSTLVLHHSLISSNHAERGGGGVKFESFNGTIEDSAITGNSAGDGGGILVQDSENIVVKRTRIEHNVASGDGGA